MSTLSGISGSYGYGYQGYNAGYNQASNKATNTNAELNGSAKAPDDKAKVNPSESDVTKVGHRSSPAECETCKNRKYQDGSDEMVSFKSASHISPEAAPARVRGHEQEHVANAYDKAFEKDGKVLSANVQIHTAICPECGRTYVSGGCTRTKIMYKNEDNPYQQNKKSAEKANIYLGANLNYGV